MSLNTTKPKIDLNPKKAAPAAEAPDQVADTSMEWDAETAQAAQAAQTIQAAHAPSQALDATACDPVADNHPVVTQRTGMALNSAPAVDDGFNDLDSKLGFGSFPIVKLDKDKFVVDGEDLEEFDAVLHQARKKFLFKGDDDHLVYSYDGERDQGGRLLSEHFADWRADGCDHEVSKTEYMEVVAQMRNTKLAGKMVLLSIPPASVNRLGGYRAELRVGHQKLLSQVVTRCFKGNKVEVGKKITFYPWNFERRSDL